MTHSRPSELPRVLIVATIGLSSQILANLSARFVLMPPPAGKRNTSTISHPATTSDRAKTTLPNENHAVPPHVVGNRSQARRGV